MSSMHGGELSPEDYGGIFSHKPYQNEQYEEGP